MRRGRRGSVAGDGEGGGGTEQLATVTSEPPGGERERTAEGGHTTSVQTGMEGVSPECKKT